jgi:mono/diheme cytochrome c family protein
MLLPRLGALCLGLPIVLFTLVGLACTEDGGGTANDAGTDDGATTDLGDASEGGADDDGSSDVGADTGADTTGDAPGEQDGATLFATHCASCHGADAEGTTLAPSNRNPNAGYAMWIVRNGRDDLPFDLAMPIFTADTLSDPQLEAIIDHLRAFSKPTDGEGLFLRFCANCHGPDGWGGRVGIDVTNELAEKGEAEVREQIREGDGGTSYELRTEFMPAFPDSELTDAEVALVIAYIATLPLGPDTED